MKMSSNLYDYIISKSDVETVLDKYNLDYEVKGDTAWLCCPFHNEKTPSFAFNLERKIYKCWGCKVSGNIISFIKEYELLNNSDELSYYNASRHLAKICNIPINLTRKEKEQMTLDEMNDISSLFEYDVSDKKSDKQETFLDTAIKKYYYRTSNYMQNKGYSKEVLDYLEMGFCLDKKDVMNNRCVFPVRDIKGNLVGWTGRTVIKGVQPKWSHAPAKRFKKALNLYNVDKAYSHILKKGSVNVVESVGNTIGLLQSGRYNTVATLGSTISKEQCAMLQEFGVKIVFWYDWDTGGFEGINLALGYIKDYSNLYIALTDYGCNDDGKAKDIGDVSVNEINSTIILSVNEYLILYNRRFISTMPDEITTNTKIKLPDGNVVLLCKNIDLNLDMPQLITEDVIFFKELDNMFKINKFAKK